MKKYSYIFRYIGIIIILLTVYFYYVYAFTLHNVYIYHDTIFPFLMADDILHGNLILKDWYGVTNPYIVYIYTCLLLPYSIFGFGEYMYVYFPALIILLLVITIFINIYKVENKISKFNIFLFVCFVLILPNGIIEFLTYAGHHIELFPLLFLSLFIINRINNVKHIFLINILLLLMFIAMMSYSYMYYVYLIPMILVILYRNIYIRTSKRELILLCLLVTAFIFNKVVIWIIMNYGGGISSNGSGLGIPNIVPFDKIPHKIFEYYITNLININNSNPFAKNIISSIPYFAKLLIIGYIFYKIIIDFINIYKLDIVNQFLIISIAIFSGLLILTTIQERPRYFVLLSIMLYLYFIRMNIYEHIKKKFYNNNIKKYYTYLAVIIIFSILILAANWVMPKKRNLENMFNNEIADIIESKNLKNGFASPSFGLITSFYLGAEVNLGMVIGKELNIPYTWADNIRWYERYSNYIIANDAEVNTFINTFGKPKEHIEVENNIHHNGVFKYRYSSPDKDNIKTTKKAHILIYDKDLSQYLLNNNFISTMKCSKKIENNNIIIIEPNTSCEGPYIPWNRRPNLGNKYLLLHKGEYLINIDGNNLDKLEIAVGNKDLKTNNFEPIEIVDLNQKKDKITFKINIDKKKYNIEFILKNNSREDIVIKEFYKKTIKY